MSVLGACSIMTFLTLSFHVNRSKREVLLKQIHELTDKMNKAMADLEEANRKIKATRPTMYSSPSPSQSTTTESLSLISGIPTPEVENEITESQRPQRTDADVLDWIAKARKSFEVFGGYISMGGPSATRGMLAGNEDGSDRDILDDEDDEGVNIDVVGAEGDEEAVLSGDEGSVATSRKDGLNDG